MSEGRAHALVLLKAPHVIPHAAKVENYWPRATVINMNEYKKCNVKQSKEDVKWHAYMKFEKYMLFTYIEIYTDSVKACMGMINTKFRVKFTFGKREKKEWYQGAVYRVLQIYL